MATKFLFTEGIGFTGGSPVFIILDGLNPNPSVTTTVVEKKTLSALGTKVGTRQLQGRNNG